MSSMKGKLHNLDKLIAVVKESKSYSDCLRKFDMSASGGNLTTLKYCLRLYNIDYSHLQAYYECPTDRCSPRKLDQILVYGKLEGTNKIKKRLIKEGIKKAECEICHRTEWLGKPMPLEFHHIDGDRLNNVLENTQLLCPNCHTFTKNYRGKNIKVKRLSLGIKKPRKKVQRTKVQRIYNTKCPPKEELEKLLWEIPSTHIGKKFGVSGKAVEKWAKKYNLTKPSRGYWAKQHETY